MNKHATHEVNPSKEHSTQREAEEPEAPDFLIGDNKHPLTVVIEGLRMWLECDKQLTNKMVRARDGKELLSNITVVAAMIASAALRASRLADKGQYAILAEEQ